LKTKPKCRIAVFCSGNGSNLQALIQAQKKGLFKGSIELVICDQPAAYAIVRANKANIPVALLEGSEFKTRNAYDKAILNILKKTKIQMVVLAGFMRILTPQLVNAYKGKMINIHPSLLPAFKGAHGIRDAFRAGVQVTGVTVHFVIPELDSGSIILQEAVKVSAKDSEISLAKKIHKVEHQLYPKALNLIIQKKIKEKK
jgi:phosphoribosylglycinamide formyltransferase-1